MSHIPNISHANPPAVMTDATLVDVPTEDASTPRRTIRVPDDEWEAALRAAAANHEVLAAVIRRRIADYAHGDTTTEYRATSRTLPGLVVDNIVGDFDAVKAHFPTKHWLLQARDVTTHQPARRRT